LLTDGQFTLALWCWPPVRRNSGVRPDQIRHCAIENSVNGGLTLKRQRLVTENREYAAFARRILRAYSRRVATSDVDSLAT
jgi:hypothetical protein